MKHEWLIWVIGSLLFFVLFGFCDAVQVYWPNDSILGDGNFTGNIPEKHIDYGYLSSPVFHHGLKSEVLYCRKSCSIAGDYGWSK